MTRLAVFVAGLMLGVSAGVGMTALALVLARGEEAQSRRQPRRYPRATGTAAAADLRN